MTVTDKLEYLIHSQYCFKGKKIYEAPLPKCWLS